MIDDTIYPLDRDLPDEPEPNLWERFAPYCPPVWVSLLFALAMLAIVAVAYVPDWPV